MEEANLNSGNGRRVDAVGHQAALAELVVMPGSSGICLCMWKDKRPERSQTLSVILGKSQGLPDAGYQ